MIGLTRISAAFFGTILLLGTAHAQTLLLSADEIDSALSHGPWPPPSSPDPSNRVSGDLDAIDFGRQLFFSPLLSRGNRFTCASCHNPATAFTDGLPRGQGRETQDRNTIALANPGLNRWFGWDGGADNLWAQTIVPILRPSEMGMTPDSVKAVAHDPLIRDQYAALFGDPGAQPATDVLVNMAKALAAYQETLVTGPTGFDRFRDALAAGDMDLAATYPAAAQRGLALFLGRGNCSFCHSGPLFSNGEFHDAGVPYFLDDDGVDTGRHGGIEALRASPFTLDGLYSDDPEKAGEWAVRQLRSQHSDFGIFRVPGLRNVARTFPYMHNGSLSDLAAVVTHYSEIDLERLHADGEAILSPLNLTASEASDLVAFLHTLTSDTP